MFWGSVPTDVSEEAKTLGLAIFQYQGGKPIGLIDPVTDLPASSMAEYLWTDFLALDPANFNGKFIRVIDKHSSLNLAGGVVFVGDSTVVPAKFQQVSGGHIVFSSGFSAFPAASSATKGWRCWDPNVGIDGQGFYCGGARWRPDNNWMFSDKSYAGWTKTGTAEEFPLQTIIPVNNGKSLLQPGDHIILMPSLGKAGNVNTATIRYRCGVNGNSGDTAVYDGGAITGGSGGFCWAERVMFQRLPDSGGNSRLLRTGFVATNSYSGVINVTSPNPVLGSPVTLSGSMDSNPYYFGFSVACNGNTDTITLNAGQIEIFTGGA